MPSEAGNYYQSEQCFRRYEPIIIKALTEYPNQVRFHSKKRKPSTDCARFTNALRSYSRCRWSTTDPIFAKFEERPLRAWFDEHYTHVGPAVTAFDEVISVASMGQQATISVKPHNAEDVRTLIDFMNRGIIVEPIEMDIMWREIVESGVQGMLNVAVRINPTTVTVF